jgi:hypothetical protein
MFEIIRQNKEDCDIFVETGTEAGHTTSLASLFNFKELHTIELSKDWYDFSKEKFLGNPNIHVHFGDSSEVLPQLLKTINKKILFWLDGHYSGGNTAKGKKSSPLLEELEAIKAHDIKNNIILIDDIRLAGTEWIPPLQDITKKILEIHQNYRFTFMPSSLSSTDVLVAKLR